MQTLTLKGGILMKELQYQCDEFKQSPESAEFIGYQKKNQNTELREYI